MSKFKNQGFTLIEILIVLAIIAILATIVMVSLNPTKQFKTARDAQRTSNLMSILNAIGQNMIDHSGVLSCVSASTTIPTLKTNISSGGGYNIADCLVPVYLQNLPYDPSKIGAHYATTSDYDLKYSIDQDSYGHINMYADAEATTSVIKITR